MSLPKFRKDDMVILNREKIPIRKISDPDKLKDRTIYTVVGYTKDSFRKRYYYLNKGADWVSEDVVLLWRARRDITG